MYMVSINSVARRAYTYFYFYITVIIAIMKITSNHTVNIIISIYNYLRYKPTHSTSALRARARK